MKEVISKGIMRKAQIILALSMIVLFSNCNKKEKTTINIIASKNWKIGVEDLNPSNDPPGSFSYHIVKNCDKDDVLIFRLDSTLVINRNENKCDQDELQTKTIEYSINRSTNNLMIDGINYNLVEETFSQIKYYINVPKGTNLTHRVYFLLQ
jgi:hypothetical protein